MISKKANGTTDFCRRLQALQMISKSSGTSPKCAEGFEIICKKALLRYRISGLTITLSNLRTYDNVIVSPRYVIVSPDLR